MRGWMLAGIRRAPGPLIGTVVSAATAAALSVAALSIAVAHTEAPAGRLAGASVVVAADTHLHVIIGHGDDAHQSLPLAAYRGVPAALAGQLARVPGVARADGESGFPGGVVRPGDVDLVAVTAKPGVPADVLAGRIRAALHGGRGYTIATGAARGDVANLDAAVERSDGQILGVALIPPIVMISLFVLAATTGLAVNLRRRRYALLRTVGATRGQVRRAIWAELAGCGLAGGLLGWLPGAALGTLGVRALAAHQMLPAGSAAWQTPWLLPIACGVSVLVAVLSGQVAARRASRTSPVQALRETAADRRWPHPVRVLLGLAAAGGAGTLVAFTFGQKSSAGQLALAFPLLLACMVAVALLGPVLVALAAWLARPLRTAGGPSARLALAAIAAQPRRTASAVIPVAMAVALVGCVYFADASIAHATAAQAAGTVTADRVISGPGLTGGALRQVRALPGVRAAAGRLPADPGGRRPGPGARLRRGGGRRPARPGPRSGRHLRPPDGAASRPARGEQAGVGPGGHGRARRLAGHRVPAGRHAVPGHGQRGVHPLTGLGRRADPGRGGGRSHRRGGRDSASSWSAGAARLSWPPWRPAIRGGTWPAGRRPTPRPHGAPIRTTSPTT